MFRLISICWFFMMVVLGIESKDKDWKTFKETYGRSFFNKYVEDYRRSIFMNSKKYIDQHNAMFRKQAFTFSLAINEFADMTDEEFTNHYLGMNWNGINTTSLINIDPLIDRGNNLSDTVDWRSKGAVTPVKYQRHCNASYAFAAIGAMESQYILHNKHLKLLSEQHLIDCSSLWGNAGCEGGNLDASFRFIREQGVSFLNSIPFKGYISKCRNPVGDADISLFDFKTLPFGREDILLAAVTKKGPVAVGIDASQLSFRFYHKGVYQESSCSSQSINHGMLAVGYHRCNNHMSFCLILKNSWGSDWGKSGYIELQLNKNNTCGVASHAIYPVLSQPKKINVKV